jgi:hypothetical protein
MPARPTTTKAIARKAVQVPAEPSRCMGISFAPCHRVAAGRGQCARRGQGFVNAGTPGLPG